VASSSPWPAPRDRGRRPCSTSSADSPDRRGVGSRSPGAISAEFTLLLRGVPEAERRRRVEALFAEIGIAGLEDRKPGKLSGGQQQRVAVARAVVADPTIVLADEPTANLDSVSSDALLEVMERLNHEHGTTFVFATHDPRVMERAHRLIRLVDGAVERDERREPVAVRPE
jgi:putative ABC transport system ATP-binding protein